MKCDVCGRDSFKILTASIHSQRRCPDCARAAAGDEPVMVVNEQPLAVPDEAGAVVAYLKKLVEMSEARGRLSDLNDRMSISGNSLGMVGYKLAGALAAKEQFVIVTDGQGKNYLPPAHSEITQMFSDLARLANEVLVLWEAVPERYKRHMNKPEKMFGPPGS